MRYTLAVVVSCALLVALASSLPISSSGQVEAASPSFTTRATSSPTTAARGDTATIVASVTSATAIRVSVDVEIYDKNGAKMIERAYDNEAYAAGQKIDHRFTWQVPARAVLGDYTIQIGVFSPDWNVQYVWNATAGSLSVIRGTQTTPIATATATATAAPTLTATPKPTATPVPGTTNTPTPRPTNTPTPVAVPTQDAAPLSGLHVAGGTIRNGSNQIVQLIGVNRSSAEYQCTSGGPIFDGPADISEIRAMQSWGIKAVRVVLNEDCWLGINGVDPRLGGTNYQNEIARYVNLLTTNDIAAIINLHFNAPGSTLAKGQQPMADRDHSPAFWRSVAARFKDNSSVLFEPYNEPHPDGGNSSDEGWRCWRDGGTCRGVSFTAAGMQELVTAIRDAGASNIIVLTGQNWGSQLDRWLEFKPNDPLNQLAAGWHSYGDGLSCQNETCWNSTLKSVLQQVPIVATEIGEFDCGHSYIDRVMSFLDQNNQSYQAWSWGPFDCRQDPALLTDWSGGATQTYGQGFKNHLLSRP